MKFSLRKKTVLMITAIALLISVVSILIVRKGITDIIRKQYISKSQDLSATIVRMIDVDQLQAVHDAVWEIYSQTPDRVGNEHRGTPEYEAYIERFSSVAKMEEFIALRDWLQGLQEVNRVECLYLVDMDPDTQCAVYLVDTAHEDVCLPGSFDAFTPTDAASMLNPRDGLRPDITNTREYGWQLALGLPIYNRAGEIIAFSCVNVSMNEIMGLRDHYLLIVAGVMVLLALVIGAAGIALVDHFIVKPVNILSEASVEYCGESADEAHHRFADLKIRTGDEIEALANSMVRMEQDINHHIASLMTTTRELISSREHEVELDRIANIDALTRVRNKRAYDREAVRLNEEIAGGTARFGLVMIDMNDLKGLNDTYGHERGDDGIRTLCASICGVFQHSPVFRIGGDEFLVVLERHDLERVDELMAEFYVEVRRRSLNPALPPWEKMSAATGCAFYERRVDKDVESVFKRADAAMYRKKREMKG